VYFVFGIAVGFVALGSVDGLGGAGEHGPGAHANAANLAVPLLVPVPVPCQIAVANERIPCKKRNMAAR